MTRAFFIVGCPRSGTTLLRRMLDAHSEIAVTPETDFGPRYVRPGQVSRKRQEFSSREAVLDDFCALANFEIMGIDERAFRVRARAHLEDPWFPLRIAMEEFGRLRNASTVGEKTPGHALHVEALADAFPEARFIYLWRDPRAVLASFDRVAWPDRSPVEVAEIWYRYSRSMRRAARRFESRSLGLRYEELVSDPESVLRAACAFLGPGFEPGMLAYHQRDRDPLSGRDSKHAQMTFEPPTPSRIDAWREQLSPDARLQVETVCGREMVLAGYEPDSPRFERLRRGIRLIPPLYPRRLKRSLRSLRTAST